MGVTSPIDFEKRLIEKLIVSIDLNNFYLKMGVTKKPCTHQFKFFTGP